MSERTQDNTSQFSVSIGMKDGWTVLSGDEIVQLYFVEDIFSYCMTGKMVFTDTRGMFEFGPITGNEVIRIHYSKGDDETPGDSGQEWEFKIYKVARVDQLKEADPEKEEVIEIFFADYMFFHLHFTQHSKAWKKKYIHNIVEDIGNDMLYADKHPEGWNNLEETDKEIDLFYMPYWYPSTALSWLCKRAKSRNTEESGYLFYNSIKGVNFISLGKLMEGNLMSIEGMGTDDYVFDDANPQYFNKILNWSISGIDMTALKNIAGATKLGFDSQTKSFIKNQYTYADMVEKHNILGNYTLFPDISNENASFEIIGNSKNEIDNLYQNAWNKRYDAQHCLSMIVRGHEGRYPGGLIKVDWKSIDEEEQKYNQHLDGIYLIKSITHVFSGYNNVPYKQRMVCIKNGYYESDIDLFSASKIPRLINSVSRG